MNTTFNNTKKLINNLYTKGELTDVMKNALKEKIDVFFLNNRITNDEYNMLMKLLEGEENA